MTSFYLNSQSEKSLKSFPGELGNPSSLSFIFMNKTDDLDTQPLVPNDPQPEQHLIVGIDIRIVAKFLVLFRDHYKKCDKATTFLETRTGESNITAITNQRDALSHFATALQKDTPDEKREEQYATAEEHFRRAIIEPYEIALESKVNKLIDIYKEYKEFVIPVKDRYIELQESPNDIAIDATIKEINNLRDNARSAKGRNMWDEEWEEGINNYVKAFDLADELYRNLERYWYRFKQIEKDNENAKHLEELKNELEKREQEIRSLKASKEDKKSESESD